ncbi:MAG: LuxR C-terminal-related transcriptional regulator [Planctomycetota bacterium]
MTQSRDLHDDNPGSGGSPDKQPEVILLNERQWSYVQNRYDLTPREREIAELICQGLRNGNIAKALHIRPGTVKTHTRNIYRKVHVRSKIGMLLRFVTDTRDFFNQYEGYHSAPIAD